MIFRTLLVGALASISIASAANMAPEEIFRQSDVWTTEKGESFKFSDPSNGKTIVTMAYTECKKNCPLFTMEKLKELQKGFSHLKQTANFYVITLDPEHDKPKVLAEFKKDKKLSFDNWHFLVADKKQTKKTSEYIGLSDYWSMDDHILHGVKILIYSADRKLEHVIDWDHEDVSEYFRKLAKN